MENRKITILSLILLFVVVSVAAQKKNEVIHFGNEKSTIYDVKFIGDNKLAVADGNEIKIYYVKDQKLSNELKDGHSDVILSIDVSSDSSKLVSAGRDGIICLWDMKDASLVTKLDYHHGVVTTVKFSPDNKFILSGGSDNEVILYDIVSNKELAKFLGHTDDILSVDFHPAGNTIASSGADKQVVLWNMKNGERIASINNLKGWQREISFSDDSTKLISCGNDANLHIWDISNPKSVRLINQLKEGREWLLTHNLNADGKTIVSGGMDGKIRIDHSFGEYSFKVKKPITRVLFKSNVTPNLKVIASTMGGGVIMIDAKNMKSHNK